MGRLRGLKLLQDVPVFGGVREDTLTFLLRLAPVIHVFADAAIRKSASFAQNTCAASMPRRPIRKTLPSIRCLNCPWDPLPDHQHGARRESSR